MEELPYIVNASGRKVFLPTSYSVDSATTLNLPWDADTSDRSLVLQAGSAGFDPDGYDDGSPLRRDLFYQTPFLTCRACNTLVTIQTNLILPEKLTKDQKKRAKAILEAHHRREEELASKPRSENWFAPPDDAAPKPKAAPRGEGTGEAQDEGEEKEPAFSLEQVPKCLICGRTSAYEMGPHDFTYLLAGSAEELKEMLRQQRLACTKMQRAYRYYLRRKFGRVDRQRQLAEAMKQYRSASVIASLWRMRLAQRALQVERDLKVIKGAHAIVLSRALRAKDFPLTAEDKARGEPPPPKKVFWYRTRQEVDLLYADYRILVDRTGYQPPLFMVENNIHEIARRCNILIAAYATRVQARWRGLTVRKFLKIFRRECVRLREFRSACVMKIQRCYRGARARRCATRMRTANKNAKEQAAYAALRAEEKREKDEHLYKDILRNRYKKERAEERTARLIGLTHPGLAGGNKMKAFYESSYGSDEVSTRMVALARTTRYHQEKEKHKLSAARDRAEHVRDMVAKAQEDRTQDRGLVRHRDEEDEWATDLAETNSGRAMRIYFQAELRERSREVIQRQSRHATKSRVRDILKAHNARGLKFQYPKNINGEPLAALYETSTPRRRSPMMQRRLTQRPSSKKSGALRAAASTPDLILGGAEPDGNRTYHP